MTLKQQKITEKLIFSGISTTVLPFAYGVGLLMVHAITPEWIIETFKVSPEIFYPASFFILFIAALIANIVLYSFPRRRIMSFLCFILPLFGVLALKKYSLFSNDSLFYLNSCIALTLASLIFTFLVNLFSYYSTPLESRVALALASICFSLGFGLFNFKNNILCILTSRAFIGFGAGVISKYLTCYLSLIAPLDKRGMFSSLYTVGLVGGLLAFNAFLSSFKSFFGQTSLFVPLFFLIYPSSLYLCIPLQIKNSSTVTFYSLISEKKAMKSLFFVTAFHIAQNFCGINQIALAPESIYGDDYGFHSAATLFVGLIVSLCVGYLLEKMGRKLITLISCLIMICGCVAFYYKFLVIVTAYIFSFGFNLGLGCVPYVILGEIFPEEYISPGAFFGTSCNWLGSALSTVIPQGTLATTYNPAFIIYFISTLSFAVCVLISFKETKNKLPAFQ